MYYVNFHYINSTNVAVHISVQPNSTILYFVFNSPLKLNNCFSNNHDNVLYVTMSHVLT